MRLIGLPLVLAVAACGAAPNASARADVPTYRGDAARTGVMPGPGPAGRPTLAWSFQAEGAIRSSPTLADGTIFVVSDMGVVHAIAFETGSERWRVPLEAEAGAATPLVIDGVVVVGDRAGVVHALAVGDGGERWRTSVGGPIPGAAAAARGAVIVATETGSAFAIDPANGNVRWRTELPGGVTRSIAATDEMVYVPAAAGCLVALRSVDGTLAWQARIASAGEGGTPTVADDLVFAPTGLDVPDPSARALVVLDASDGTERWRRTSPSGDVVYAPAVRDGRAWIVSEDETVVAVDATTGTLLWTATTGAPNDALPAVWDTTVFVATTGGNLEALDTESGALRWEVDIVGTPYAPIVSGGLVLVGTNVGLLYAFGDHPPAVGEPAP
jgi:outer membrane protein assembly factor BamB